MTGSEPHLKLGSLAVIVAGAHPGIIGRIVGWYGDDPELLLRMTSGEHLYVAEADVQLLKSGY